MALAVLAPTPGKTEIMKSRTGRTFEWVFALASVALAWNLDLSNRLGSLAAFLGAQSGTFLYRLLVDGGVPVLLVGIAGAAIILYERVVWPFWPWSRCKRGWWAYSLVVRDNSANIQVAGYFFLDDRIEGASIPEGRAYYVNTNALTHRGDWSASHVFVGSDSLRCLFSMRAQQPDREPLPSHYDGYFQVAHTSDSPVVGRDVWCGYFNDLGDRHKVWGPVVAERLRRVQAKDAATAKAILDKHALALVCRTLQRIS